MIVLKIHVGCGALLLGTSGLRILDQLCYPLSIITSEHIVIIGSRNKNFKISWFLDQAFKQEFVAGRGFLKNVAGFFSFSSRL